MVKVLVLTVIALVVPVAACVVLPRVVCDGGVNGAALVLVEQAGVCGETGR
jgi:hypothetical protein